LEENYVVERVKEIKDLRIIVSSDMKASRQCGKAADKGNQILGMNNRTFSSRTKAVMLHLYKALFSEAQLRVLYTGMASTLNRGYREAREGTRTSYTNDGGGNNLDYEIRLKGTGLTTR